jgi:hypothetical protein
MQSVKEIMKKIPNKLENLVPRKKEDTTIRLIVQQDVAENVRQLIQAISKLKDKDINNFANVIERIANTINKRISK